MQNLGPKLPKRLKESCPVQPVQFDYSKTSFEYLVYPSVYYIYQMCIDACMDIHIHIHHMRIAQQPCVLLTDV